MSIVFTHNTIDLAAAQRNGIKPADRVIRGDREIWLVPFGAISLTEPIDWRTIQREAYVHIPLVPYLMHTDPALALGFMLQLGLRCAYDLGRPLSRIHLATGSPVNEVYDHDSQQRSWQYHVGLGVVLSKE